MGELIEIASVILKQATDRVEVNAQNIANTATPGYRRRISFAEVLAARPNDLDPRALLSVVSDLAEGKPIDTGNPTDLAISGPGFFVVRGEQGDRYTRSGQFHRSAEGRLMTAEGLAVQVQGGGDIRLDEGPFAVAADGMVTQGGSPLGRIAVVDFDGPPPPDAPTSGFDMPGNAARAVTAPTVRQGFLEASNVSVGEEMVAMMQSLRQAEAGQRVAMLYDELMGRALSTFGQG